jgi:predicted transcriptional regulator
MRILKPSEIRALRSKLGLTQARLAELAGLTQAYIAKIEAGTADPRISALERISKALEEISEEKRITAEQIMAKPIIAVRPKDRIKKVVQLMEAHDISQLPVLDGKTQVGSISETTLIHKISKGGDISRLARSSADEIMGDSFPTVSKSADTDTIYHLLEHNPAILVVDQARPIGIITKADILKLTRPGT